MYSVTTKKRKTTNANILADIRDHYGHKNNRLPPTEDIK